ncbi:unnamed protein product [Parajaminaea phylloscopi]
MTEFRDERRASSIHPRGSKTGRGGERSTSSPSHTNRYKHRRSLPRHPHSTTSPRRIGTTELEAPSRPAEGCHARQSLSLSDPSDMTKQSSRTGTGAGTHPKRTPAPNPRLEASDVHFRDHSGRAVLLRGVNFSGSAKAPLAQPSHRLEGFWESAEAGGHSFVGQPLDLQDGSADAHLTRLRLWGFNCLRFVFTWEALERHGPGKYDYEYMDYVVAVLRKCKQHGFRVYMDPHQDVFSRFTGGSGAPYWTLPACGIDHTALTATQAAFVHAEWPSPDSPDPAAFPDMLWATNYTRLAPATLSALFFAGHDLAPRCRLDGKPISHWLQDHFLAACRELAVRIRDAGDLFDDCVIGWDSLNEPNPTYIGLEDVRKLPQKWQLRQGPMPTPSQSMILGTGEKQRVQNWAFGSLGPKKAGEVVVDPQGASVWLSPEQDGVRGGSKWGWQRDADWPLGQCVWEAHGVWEGAKGEVLKPDYFHWKQGSDDSSQPREVDFLTDYWLPFWRRYAATIRDVHPDAIMFVQPPVFERPPEELKADLAGRACVSCHFYDGLTLITKHWNWFNADAIGLMRGKYSALVFALRFGAKAVRKVMRDQLGYLRDDTLSVLGKYPTIIGEIGVPFDLDKKRSYYGDARGNGAGDFSAQSKALDASLNGCDGENLLNYTLWTYCPDSTHAWGDGWNGEDLSVWSLDDRKSPKTQMTMQSGPGVELSRDSSSATLSAVKGTAKSTVLKQTVQTESLSDSRSEDGDLMQASTQLPNSIIPLIDGSRAAAAFYRPYPIAVAGDPVSIDFDIASATFKLVIDAQSSSSSSNTAGSAPTEIFVPLVHYAQDASLAALMVGSGASSASACQRVSAVPRAAKEATSDTKTRSPMDTWGSELIEDENLPPLSVDVTCSSGTWSTHGQVLKWWPEVGDGAAAGRSRQEIVIRRLGGPIKAVVETHTGTQSVSNTSSSPLAAFESCFRACADACVVM